MKQGELWKLNLDSVKGSEQMGLRPVLIISGNLANKLLQTVIVCPLTTQIKNFKGDPILQPNSKNELSKTSEVLVFHIRSVSKERFVEDLGEVNIGVIDDVKSTLKDVLNF